MKTVFQVHHYPRLLRLAATTGAVLQSQAMNLPASCCRILSDSRWLWLPVCVAILGAGCGPSSGFKAALEKARAGDPQAQVEVGLMYLAGADVKESETEALNWHKQAAQKGFPAGQREYGRRLRDGIGGGRNLAGAREWFERAAVANDVAAQTDLAVLVGIDTQPPELVEALMWALLAEKNGATNGAALQKIIAVQMTASQLAEARRKAAEFVIDK